MTSIYIDIALNKTFFLHTRYEHLRFDLEIEILIILPRPSRYSNVIMLCHNSVYLGTSGRKLSKNWKINDDQKESIIYVRIG